MSLEKFLCELVRARGPLPLDIFQQWVLYHPEWGYYRTKVALGTKGDFVTAPEISQMFGELVGLWVLDLWHQMGCPNPFHLLELGPGKGTLMADLLRVTTHSYPNFLAALRISFVEINPLLQEEQKKRLSGFPVAWYKEVEDALEAQRHPCCILAHEFFDTLPIKQYQKQSEHWMERCVTWDESTQSFRLIVQPSSFALVGGKEGDIYEESPQREAIYRKIMEAVRQRTGALWVCDYGYTEPSFGDSLQSLYQQKISNPLHHLGDSDLSSHVNFYSLRYAAKQNHLSFLGPLSQADFLKNLGLLKRLEQLQQGQSSQTRALLQSQYERLTNPLQMGNLFKVFVAYAPEQLRPYGFHALEGGKS